MKLFCLVGCSLSILLFNLLPVSAKGDNTKDFCSEFLLDSSCKVLFSNSTSVEDDVDDARDSKKVDWKPWLNALKNRVESKWDPPSEKSSRRAIVQFFVERDGTVFFMWVKQKSDSDALDQSAIKAIQASNPFPALPASYSKRKITINFTFDVNIRGGTQGSGVYPNEVNLDELCGRYPQNSRCKKSQ